MGYAGHGGPVNWPRCGGLDAGPSPGGGRRGWDLAPRRDPVRDGGAKIKTREIVRALILDADGNPFKWAGWELRAWRAVADPRVNLIILSAPRGYGKTSLAAALIVSELMAGDVEIHVGAGDLKQARRLKSYVEAFSKRSREIRSVLTIRNDTVTCKETGSAAEVHESNDTALGLGGISRKLMIVLDEAAIIPEKIWGYFASAAAKAGDSKIVLLSTAGEGGASWFDALTEQAKSERQAVVIHLHGEDLKPPRWVKKRTLSFLQRILPAGIRKRFFTNEAGNDNALFTPEQLDGLFRGDVSYRDECATAEHYIGLDLGVKHDRSALSVVGLHEGRAVLEYRRLWKPKGARTVDLGEVRAAVLDVASRFSQARVVADPWQALSMIGDLRKAGVPVMEFTFSDSSICQLSQLFFSMTTEGNLRCPVDDELRAEFAGLITRSKSWGGWRLDHARRGYSDMTISVALACIHLVGRVRGAVAAQPFNILSEGRRKPIYWKPPLQAEPGMPSGGLFGSQHHFGGLKGRIF